MLFLILISSLTTLGAARDVTSDTHQDSQVLMYTTAPKLATQPTYLNIQETINQAASGSTLQIPAGTYPEILTIDKPLTLIGQGATQTLIHPMSRTNGYAIQITAPGVTLNGFDISNMGSGLYSTGVKISAPHTTIQHCTIHDTPVGVAVWSNDNLISDCEFQHCSDDGAVLLGTTTTTCTRNNIRDCTFINNCDGIELQYASQNMITHCEFSENTHAGIDAIISSNDKNTFSQCTFNGNFGFGVYLAGSSCNTIAECDFTNDILTLVHSPENTLINSGITHIYLMDESLLHIIDCGTLEKNAISSTQSKFEIQDDHTIQNTPEISLKKTVYQSFLLLLQSRIRTLKTLLG
jgi:parallel beta-helix repeat protein